MVSPYTLCKVSGFSKRIPPKLCCIFCSNVHRQLKLLCSLDIQRVYFNSLTRERKAFANEAKKIETKIRVAGRELAEEGTDVRVA